jgi:hypothetical protein
VATDFSSSDEQEAIRGLVWRIPEGLPTSRDREPKAEKPT